ncbi:MULTISPECIES: signal peptide peptidase SppA [unclassified Lonepinella]|uniref:signal peptide peptidase SppA n=1 Tax=unclassified Lonepinella TaxID=2642006 RepID=UPI0036DC8FDD
MKTIFNFFKLIWKALNFIRRVVMNLVFLLFVLFLATVISLFNLPKNNVQLVGEQGALLLNLDGYLADNRETSLSWQKALNELEGSNIPRKISTFDVVYAIENAKNDERIKGLVLDLNYFEGADLPALEYVGSAIQHFKAQHKPVIALSENYSQDQYFLASFADEIYLNPVGTVDIYGLSAQNLYFKSMLDQLEVTPHIFRVGTYKSAVEPFLRDDMSPEARANGERWLKGMWTNFRDIVAKNRQIEPNQVLPDSQQYLADLKALKGDSSAYAKQRKLITEFTTRTEIQQKLTALFGENTQDDVIEFKNVDFDTYLAALPDRQLGDSHSSNPTHKIAVVNVEGAIVDGESEKDEVGGDTIANLLHQAADDEAVKAVILRVNSPGGSAFASEVIRQEIDNLQAIGKPVVTSMGAEAASGGYWISSTTDYIVADKNTITGSIGIFSIFPTFENSLKKIGVSADGIRTSKLSELSSTSPLSDELKEVFQLEIEQGYDRFLDVVSRGRHLSKAEVDKIAQGQVWLGQDALQHKLVDELGDFETAVKKAKELADQQTGEKADYSVEWFDEEPQGFKALLQSLQQGTKSLVKTSVSEMVGLPEVKQVQGQLKNQLGILGKFNDPKGQYLYCLNCGVVK